MASPGPHPVGNLSGLLDVSQHGEASIVSGLVGQDWPPYLVDVGAHDGRSLSNSFPFLQLGWAGLVIEPLPTAFARLDELYRDRPDVRCLQVACADVEGEMPLVVGDDGPSTMTSTLRAGGGGSASVPVSVRTLTSLLNDCAAPPDFSLLLVDAEGFDYEVLVGLDLARYRPRVIVTEDDPEHLAAKSSLLQENGYLLYAIVAATNSIWIRSEFVNETPPAGGGSASGLPRPLLSPQEAIRTIGREALERRCAELERSRDEIWRELMVVRTSRSWRLTRPLRNAARHLRFLRRRG